MKNSNKKYGFTLMELMVAVIIIAVLAAVAVPQYKKAVLKSRFSTLMPLAQSVAKGNEVYYLANGEYADRKDKLDVEGPATNPEGTQVNVVDSEDYNYVIASRNSLPNKYIVYQAHSPKFAGNIHCEAEDKNTPAMELCKSLGGKEIGGSQTDGYVTYVLEGTQGDDDKLPTSLAKLAANLCDGKSNCESHVEGNTVITQECTGNMSSNAGQTCINKTYNDEGTQVDYERTNTTCRSFKLNGEDTQRCITESFNDQNTKTRDKDEYCYTDYATWEDGVCTPARYSNGNLYFANITTEGDKRIQESRLCAQFTDGICSVNQQSRNTNVNGKSAGYQVVRCNGTVNADLTCNDGEWISASSSDYNDQGKVTRILGCASYSAENICTEIRADSYWRTYADDDITQISKTTMDYSGSNNSNVRFTTTDTQTNQITNTVTCAFADADWEHGTCKPGTAI